MKLKYLFLLFFSVFFIFACSKKEENDNLDTSYVKNFIKDNNSYYIPYEKDRILQLVFNSKKNYVDFYFYTSEGKFLKKEKTLKYNIEENNILNFKDDSWQFFTENKQLFLSTKEHLYKLYKLKDKVVELYDISLIKNKSITIKEEDKTFCFLDNITNSRNYFEVTNNIKKFGYSWEKIAKNKYIVLFLNTDENFIEEENIITFDFLDGEIQKDAKLQISYYDKTLKDFKVETKIIQKVSTLK